MGIAFEHEVKESTSGSIEIRVKIQTDDIMYIMNDEMNLCDC